MIPINYQLWKSKKVRITYQFQRVEWEKWRKLWTFLWIICVPWVVGISLESSISKGLMSLWCLFNPTNIYCFIIIGVYSLSFLNRYGIRKTVAWLVFPRAGNQKLSVYSSPQLPNHGYTPGKVNFLKSTKVDGIIFLHRTRKRRKRRRSVKRDYGAFYLPP